MASVTVTCPECGEKLRLNSRSSLGKKRPCPKCGVPFVLDEETNCSSYDLDLDARGVSPKPKAEPETPMLKRGVGRDQKPKKQKAKRSGSASGGSFVQDNQALVYGLGAGGLVAVGMLLAFFLLPGRGDTLTTPTETAAAGEETPGTSVASTETDGTPRRTGPVGGNPGSGSDPPRRTTNGGNSGGAPTNVTWETMQVNGFDLLASVDPTTEAQRGTWRRDGRAIVSEGNGILPLKLHPVDDYRVTMRFTRERGNQQVNMILPVPGGSEPRQFLMVIDWRGQGDHGIETLRGSTPGRGNPTNSRAVTIENGRQNRINVDVKASGPNVTVRATMNGTKLYEWSGPATDLANPYWPTKDKRMFGLGSGSGNGSNLVIRYDQFVVNPISNWGWESPPRGIAIAGIGTPSPETSSSNPPRSNPPRTTPSRTVASTNNPPRTTPPRTTPPRTNPPLSTGTTATPGGERWWQFRGSDFSRTRQTGLPTQWSERENIVWKVDLPARGGSSPIVVGDRIFVTSYSGYGESKENPGDINSLVRHLFCIDRSNGNVLWHKGIPSLRPPAEYKSYIQLHGYASTTPCSDGQRVFVHFGNSGVYAFDLNGNQLWHKDVGSQTNGFGSAGSPAIIGGNLVVNASIESESLIAFNPQNGQQVWTTKLGQSYTTPVLVRANGRDEIIVPSGRDGRGIVGFNAASGEPLWQWKGFKSNRYICASPIFHNGIIYATGSVDGPLAAVRPGGSGDVTTSQQVWRGPGFAIDVTSPVFHNGNIFWIGGRAAVFDAQSGEQTGRARISGGCWSTPLVAENRLYVVSQVEGIYVFEANAEMTQIAKNVIREPGPQDNWNASLVPDQDRLLARSPRALYCIGR